MVGGKWRSFQCKDLWEASLGRFWREEEAWLPSWPLRSWCWQLHLNGLSLGGEQGGRRGGPAQTQQSSQGADWSRGGGVSLLVAPLGAQKRRLWCGYSGGLVARPWVGHADWRVSSQVGMRQLGPRMDQPMSAWALGCPLQDLPDLPPHGHLSGHLLALLLLCWPFPLPQWAPLPSIFGLGACVMLPPLCGSLAPDPL